MRIDDGGVDEDPQQQKEEKDSDTVLLKACGTFANISMCVVAREQSCRSEIQIWCGEVLAGSYSI